MAARPPGRRTESLFDNRYRYDYIFPRGRSGETLRAYDLQDRDRPVVIKRPAPQDAPPMRAGQEVSIRNEKQALERLSGHPVLTELRGSGQFRVGGNTHEYIVMDLAQGQIVEQMVLERAQQGACLPELETLVIMDGLLSLLAHAHERQVIYNDVDAKHLFWDRASYRLKVIDWGNAVFTDEPGAPPSITRSTDVFQCGELLYFILTGGNRLQAEGQDGDTFFVNFGDDADRIPARLQAIITRAVNPDPKRRYGTIQELRQALAEQRQPLEKARDEIIARVRKRVRGTASQEELEELAGALRVALEMDPGFPDAVSLDSEIQLYLRQITIQADLDAVRIYLESGNWPRALSLLHDLLPKADPVSEALIRFLMAATGTLETLRVSPPPAGFLDALTPLFKGSPAEAGQILLTTSESRPPARQAQWLLAEQLTVHVPDVILLRPHLVRLQHDLGSRPGAEPALSLLDEIMDGLSSAPMPGLAGLMVIYQQTLTRLTRLEEQFETLSDLRATQETEDCLASVIRAQRAAHDIISRLDETGQQVFTDPSRAGTSLREAAMIDPTSPHFGALHDYFDEVHQAVAALGQFKPKSDGTNLAAWFADVEDFLQPYLEDLPDRQLHAAASALQRAAEGWTTVVNYLALGRRQPTIEALRDTADTIRPINEQIAAWLGTLANRLPDATFTERHSPNTKLADLVIDGWKAWDKGDSIRAAEFGKQAHAQARTEGERFAANRLRRLAELLDTWLAENGPQSAEKTDRAETETLSILLAEEEQERRTFAEQMPSTALYLRAMGRGIVAYMRQSSSAGWRALYLHYVLRGMLSLLSNQLDEAEFWRDVASKTYDDARTHRAFQVLDRALTGRRLVETAEQTLNAVSGPDDLEAVRKALNAPLARELLAGAEQSVQATTDGLRAWSDGHFHAAQQSLETALTDMERAVQTGGLHIDPYLAWLTRLRDTAADLAQTRVQIEQGALSTQPEPDPALAQAHRRIVTTTLDTLGPDYAHQVRQWEDMYRAVLDTYTTQRLSRREKLTAFGHHFASLFITKHPAYPLFRHWESVIEQLPPDEPESEVITLPDAHAPVITEEELDYLEEDREPEPEPDAAAGRAGRDLPWDWIIVGAVAVLVVIVALALWRSAGRDQDPPHAEIIEPTQVAAAPLAGPNPSTTPTHQPPASPTTEPTSAVAALAPTGSPVPTFALPTTTPTPLPVTPTPSEAPTESGPPSATPTLFVTSTLRPVGPTEVAEAPAAGNAAGEDVLAALDRLPAGDQTWPEASFAPGEDGAWLLSTAGNPTLTVELPPDLLGKLFMPGAANALNSAEAVLELVSYDANSLANGEVALGLGAKNSSGQVTIGEVQFSDPNLVILGKNQNGQFGARTQVPLQKPQLELSIRRINDTTLSFFIDGKSLGDSVYLFAQNDPVTLVLFATGRDVIIKVSRFQIDFSPRDELP